MSRHVYLCTVLLCGTVGGVGLLACANDVPAGGFVVRDSAGVTIVESHVPAWEAGREWVIPVDPAVRIGTVEGAAPHRLYQVRDATVLSDGRIVVVNSGTHEVRIYSEAGRHLRTVGGEGDGPGEFRNPWQIYRAPVDSMVVVDFGRISVFDPAGEFIRSHLYRPPAPDDRFSDGSFLAIGFAAGVDPFELGTVRPAMALIRARPGVPERDTIALVDGGDHHRIRLGRGIANPRKPLGRVRSTVVAGEQIVTGDGSSFEFALLGAGGAPVRIIRRTADLTLESSDIEQFEAVYLGDAGSERSRRLRTQVLRETSYPDRLPGYDRLLVDGTGSIWARHYVIANEPRRWSVFEASGRWLGVVDMPAGLEVLEIGADYVLGTTEDSLGIEYVQLHALEKPA